MYRIVGAACLRGGFTMVYVRDDGDVTQIFDHNFASGILEIARYCTRINRSTKQDHKHPPQTSIAEFLCDHIHGALKGVISCQLHHYSA